ncbi:MAG: hypothetical protein II762_04225 [Ruminococcus sp.]|nr:hypothetical protein [Ruminococcus sp.]
MKQNILFAILLAAVLLLGFFSAEAASLLGEDNSGQATVVQRNTGAAGAVYLSGGEIGFDPMGALHITGGNALNTGFVSAFQRSVSTALAQTMSSFRESGQIGDDYARELTKTWQISRDGFIYANHWKYLDTSEKECCMDFIIDPIDFSIVYARFWRDEQQEQEISAQEVNRSLDRLSEYSAVFHADIEVYNDRLNKAYDDYYSKNGYDIAPTDPNEIAAYPYITTSDRAEILNILKTRCSLMRSFAEEITDSPMLLYWTYLLGISTVDIENIGTPGGFYDLIYSFLDNPELPAKSYSVYKGRIYQTITSGRRKLIIIFNIAENCVEGFYVEK